MKKKLKSCIALVLMLCCFLGMVGCDEPTETMSGETEDGVELSFSAEFYDNSGNKWFEA